MPRVVDRAARRRELMETTWRVVAERGLSGATMRQIAEAAGYANGALKPYFPSKRELIEATYDHVFTRTEKRIEAAVAGLSGVAALRALCCEVLPMDAELVQEARLVIAFWDQAARDESEAALAAASLEAWRVRVRAALDEAGEAGELRAGSDAEAVIDALLTWMYGAQVTAVMDAGRFGGARLEAQLDAVLGLLTP
ncbi:MAG: TetR/AcrR family transcriptional regulator [Micrococcus sp.]|nr:TetR/AcrR family transcriptional regulator [Micrococcus sp.]